MHSLPSKLLEDAVEAFASLPGIGKKTALRLALHLHKANLEKTQQISEALINFKTNISTCKECHTICDGDTCSICINPLRDNNIICIVEDLRDVIALENTAQYRGKYHVLGGIINPMEGVGPENLHIESLIQKLNNNSISEIIIALPSTMEGDTTSFYITKKIKHLTIKITTLARGIPLGGELEYADELTLGRSILERINYNK